MQKIIEIMVTTVVPSLITGITSYLVARLQFKNKKADTAASTLAPAIENGNKLYPILWQLLVDFNSSRICIFEFHNGGKYYSGRSIQRVTVSFEVAKAHVKRIATEFQGAVMSDAFHIGIKELIEKGRVYYMDVNSLPEMGTKALLQHYHSKAIAGFLYTNDKNEPIGCMTVCFDRLKPLNDLEIDLLTARCRDIDKFLL